MPGQETIFCGAITIDGCPVNQLKTKDNRLIAKKINDENGGFYKKLHNSELHDSYKSCIVYLWVSDDE
jgi:hypothetical protein